MSLRDDLIALAVTVRDETKKKRNTAKRVGGLLYDIATNLVIAASTAEVSLWVDNEQGDDTNDGLSQANAVRSLEKVLEITGNNYLARTTINIVGNATPYDPAPFFTDRFVARFLHIKGHGHDEVVGDTAITSQSGITVTVTLGGAADAYRGMHLELDNGGTKFYGTIAENSTTDVTLCAPKTFNMAATETVRVVRPAVKFTPDDSKPLPQFRGDSTPAMGGPFRGFYSRASIGMVWENVEFAAAPGEYKTYYFRGSHCLVGVIVSGAAVGFGQTIRFVESNIWSGKWEPTGNYLNEIGITDEIQTGWGLSMIDSVDPTRPGVMVLERAYWQGSYVGGPPLFQGGSFAQFSDGYRFTGADAYDNYSEWPYEAVLSALQDSHIELLDRTSAGNGSCYGGMSQDTDNLPSLYAEDGSTIKLIGPPTIRDLGDGIFAHARGGRIVLGNVTPSFPNGGSESGKLLATDGGRIELDSGGGIDFSVYDDATIGSVNALTRPDASGAWSVGESVADQAAAFTDLPRDGAPAIYRKG